ncbi:MAG: metallophosphoesterase [Candidatus Thermoplasmatota archaeon]|nr:metallophosphoesterase [Candidatus Thermoplasmatota archaeon]
MDHSSLHPIPNEPALLAEDTSILVIADLHIGIEQTLQEQGIHTASQTDLLTKRVLALCKIYKPKELVLLGDIKHAIPSTTVQERRDVKAFFQAIQNYSTIHLIPGNHDGNIRWLTPDSITVHPSDGVCIDGIGFAHGHRWPNKKIMECTHLVCAHTHPTIMFTDRLGHKTFEPCWLKAHTLADKRQEKYPDSWDVEVLVMPAFNPLCGGLAANTEGMMGPLGNIIDIKNAQVYLLDGSALGKARDIV